MFEKVDTNLHDFIWFVFAKSVLCCEWPVLYIESASYLGRIMIQIIKYMLGPTEQNISIKNPLFPKT